MLAEERRDAVASERRGNALWRVAAISRILSTTTSDSWGDVLRVAQSPQTRLRLVETSNVVNADTLMAKGLTDRLNGFLETSPNAQARVDILSQDTCDAQKRTLKDLRKDFDKQNLGDAPRKPDAKSGEKPDHEHHHARHKAPWELRYLDRFDCNGAPVMQLAVPIFSTVPGQVSNDGRPNIWLEAVIGGVTPPTVVCVRYHNPRGHFRPCHCHHHLLLGPAHGALLGGVDPGGGSGRAGRLSRTCA